MRDIVERLRNARQLAECWRVTEQAADEIERLRTLVLFAQDLERNQSTDIERQTNEITQLREELHYCNSTCDLAMKHRDEAEAEIERLRTAMHKLQGCDIDNAAQEILITTLGHKP